MKRFSDNGGFQRGLLAAALGLGLTIATDASSQGKPQDHVVTITGMNFGHLPSGLVTGDTITWVNKDTVPHSATARDRSFDVRLNPGQSKKTVLQKSGTILVYCVYHPMMRGQLVVAAK